MYENHSRSPISNLNSRRIGWRARKKKVRPDETFSQSTKSIRCDMTQVTWKSPSTYYPHPVEAHARPTLPLLLFSQKYIIGGGATAKGCAVNKCIEGRKLEQKSVPLPQTRKEESAKNIEIEFLRAASLCSVMMIIIL